MQTAVNVLNLLFGADGELRGIVWTTVKMSVSSTLISSVLGLSLGTLLGCRDFRGKRLVMRVLHTLMSTPPVVAGLIVYMVLSRKGPLGSFGLLFSLPAMIIAQVILITPIITGLTASAVSARAPAVTETARGIGLSNRRAMWLIFRESRMQLISVALMGFGRALAEVGAVQLVGGNVKYRTRVMTTAIMLETNMGNFELGVGLGVILLIISFAVNLLAGWFQDMGADGSGSKKPKKIYGRKGSTEH